MYYSRVALETKCGESILQHSDNPDIQEIIMFSAWRKRKNTEAKKEQKEGERKKQCTYRVPLGVSYSKIVFQPSALGAMPLKQELEKESKASSNNLAFW